MDIWENALKIDTRIKLIIFVVMNLCIFGMKDIILGSLCFLGVCLISLIMGEKKNVYRYFILFIILVAVSYGCRILPSELMSIVSIFSLFVRVMIPVALFATTFINTTTVGELVTAMYKMHMPKSIVITFSMTLRFFPTLGEEIGRVYDAMRLRGLEFSVRNLVTKPGIMFEATLIPLVMRSANIAEELSASAVTRGIDNPGKRTSIIEMKTKSTDWLVLGVTMVYVCFLFYLKFLIFGRIA
ncbi:MAG: energy-coupling factor transporter transmembrane protein EcfT [Butyrivibrio sp.]|nr:energy-coupling factor transporter transmembrane protein EcfT [Butyrivibrio sp.]